MPPNSDSKMPSMHQKEMKTHSRAKAIVQQHWKTQVAIHQGVIEVITELDRKCGNICETGKTPSQMKMGPQMEKA